MKVVLDTRFLAEFFFSHNNEIIRKTEELSQSGNGIIPSIVICEIIQLIYSKEGKKRAETAYSSMMESNLRIENLTPSIAKEAGILKSRYRHVPVGDCIIAATAIRNQARILSDDPHFDEIKETKRTWL